MQKFFKKQIAFPQDHGSWVFIVSPLLAGIFMGKAFSYATLNLAIAGPAIGYHTSRNRVEANSHRYAPVNRHFNVVDLFHSMLEAMMDELKWELLTEVYGRMDAEMIKSYLEAQGIDVELFQEAVGHNVFPTTIDGFGRVQIFVSKKNVSEARKLYRGYQEQINKE